MNRLVALLVSCSILLVGTQSVVHAQQVPGDATGDVTPVVDTQDRAAVIQFFNQEYVAYEHDPLTWTGDHASCYPGGIPDAVQQNTLRRINYYRAMAGVPAGVMIDKEYNHYAQAAAFLMSANEALSHSPPPSWTCYTLDAAEGAAHSNLALGSAAWESVTAFMEDAGDNNTEVGHRIWLLRPATVYMGVGSVVGDPNLDPYPSSSAIWVTDESSFGYDLPPDIYGGFLAWPPPGYVPYHVIFPRWSLSMPEADFTQAEVTMQADGEPVPVVIESRRGRFSISTLVWRPEEMWFGTPWPRPKTDYATLYTVRVSNVTVAGASQVISYSVTAIDPHLPPLDIRAQTALTSPEHSAPGSVIGQLIAVDPDLDELHDFDLEPGPGDHDNDAFLLSDQYLLVQQPLDFERGPVYQIHIRATDSRGLSTSRAMTVTVSDQEDPPPLAAVVEISEDAPLGTVVTQLPSSAIASGAEDDFFLATGEYALDSHAFEIVNGSLVTRARLDAANQPVLFAILGYTRRSGQAPLYQSVQINVLDSPEVYLPAVVSAR